jgi:hypothetical protein
MKMAAGSLMKVNPLLGAIAFSFINQPNYETELKDF